MINYFISSTFSDMHMERDTIALRIIPQIKAELYKRGEDIAVTDLRWGISTEDNTEIAKQKIMSVCLKAIDGCKPCLIVLLGDRYGTTPDSDSAKALLNGEYRDEFRNEDLNRCSITEIEVTHAIHMFKHMDSKPAVIICMRETLKGVITDEADRKRYFCGTDEEEQALLRLKEKLREQFPNDCITYSVKWDQDKREIVDHDFEKTLTAHIRKQVYATFPEEPETPGAIQDNLELMYASRNEQSYFVRKREQDQIHDFLKSADHNLLIKGKSGSGKTAILRKIFSEVNRSKKVIMISCGVGMLRCAEDVLHYLYLKLTGDQMIQGSDIVNEPEKYEDYLTTINEALAYICSCDKIVILIDGLDMLIRDGHLINVDFFPEKIDNCKMVISCTEEFAETYLCGKVMFSQEISLDEMTEADTEECLICQLNRIRKEIPQNLKDSLKKIALFKSPMFISLLCDRINMMVRDDFRAVEKQKRHGIRTEDILFSYIENKAESITDESYLIRDILDAANTIIPKESVNLLLGIVCSFDRGIRIKDIAGILTMSGKCCSELDVRILVYYLEAIFVVNDGEIVDFSHGMIRTVCRRITQETVDNGNLDTVIYLYLNEKVADDSSIKTQSYLKYSFLTNNIENAQDYIFRVANSIDHIEEFKVGTERRVCSSEIMEGLISLYFASDRQTEVLNFIHQLSTVHDVRKSYYILEVFINYLTPYFNVRIPPKASETIMNDLEVIVFGLLKEDKYDENFMRLAYRYYEIASIFTNDIRRKRYCVCESYRINRDLLTGCPKKIDEFKYLLLDDLGHICLKYADCFPITEWERTVEIVDEAINLIETELRSVRFLSLPVPIEVVIYELYKTRFYIVFRRVQNLRQIGWDEKITLQMEGILISSIEKIKSEIAIIENMSTFSGKDIILFGLMNCLSDYDTYRNHFNLDLLTSIREYAERIMHKSKTSFDVDRLRSIELKLALAEYDTDRISAMEHYFRAFLHAQKVLDMEENEDSRRVYAITLYELAQHEYIYAKESYEKGETDTAIRLAADFITKVFPDHQILEEKYRVLPMLYSDMGELSDNLNEWLQFGIRISIRVLRDNGEIFKYDTCKNALHIIKAIRSYLNGDDGDNLYLIAARRVYYLLPNLENQIEYYYALILQRYSGIKNDLEYYKELYHPNQGFMRSTLIAWIRIAKEKLCDAGNEKVAFEFISYSIGKENRIPGKQNTCLSLLKADKKFYESDMMAVGRWLCEHMDLSDVVMATRKNNLLELAAIKYAYSGMNYAMAERIINNGYERYLELPFLYCIRKYERKKFDKLMLELKQECLAYIYDSAAKYSGLIGDSLTREIVAKCGERLGFK